MANNRTSPERLPVLAAELTRCTEELLACIDRDDMESFTGLLDDRRRLVDELRFALTTGPAPEGGWRAVFAGALDGEARLKVRVESEQRRLAEELQGVGEARANFDRIAEAYMEPDV